MALREAFFFPPPLQNSRIFSSLWETPIYGVCGRVGPYSEDPGMERFCLFIPDGLQPFLGRDYLIVLGPTFLTVLFNGSRGGLLLCTSACALSLPSVASILFCPAPGLDSSPNLNKFFLLLY